MLANSRTSRKAARVQDENAGVVVSKSVKRVKTERPSLELRTGVRASGPVSMYKVPPSEELSLDEFETFAVDRLVVLRTLENLRARGVTKTREVEKHLGPVLRERELRGRKDEVSHFILRLAYSRTEELRRWYLTQECALFKYKLERLSASELRSALRSFELPYGEVDAATRAAHGAAVKALVCANSAGLEALNAAGSFERLAVFEVPFAEACEAVGRREVVVAGGKALVPEHRLQAIVMAKFRTHLSRSMTTATRSFAHAVADPRLAPLLEHVDRVDVLGDAAAASDDADDADLEALGADQLDTLAERSMPLCMRLTHEALRRDHKLKHWGRVQYGLFLKAAGLPMEEQLAFFQHEFTKVMSVDAFNKEHAYGVRHRYGAEGKRTDYSAYGCFKIIMDLAPGPGEQHGCPYKHMSVDALSSALDRARLEPKDKRAVFEQVKTHNYQVACQLHFEATHPDAANLRVDTNGVGNHPNAFFKASRRYHKAKANPDAGPADSTAPYVARPLAVAPAADTKPDARPPAVTPAPPSAHGAAAASSATFTTGFATSSF